MWSCISLSFLLALASPAWAAPLAPGAEAPALAAAQWIPQAPDEPDLVLFVGSWCPLSREVLDRLSIDEALNVVAVSQEPPRVLRAFLEVGGWQGLTLGSDPDRSVWEAWLGEPLLSVRLPYAFVLSSDGHVLWRGPAVSGEDEEPLAALEAALRRARDGSFDLDASRDAALGQARVEVMLEILRYEPRLNRLRRTVKDLAAATLAPEQEGRAADVLNEVAWRLATSEPVKRGQLELGLVLAEHSLELRPDAPTVLDTRARLLWNLGQRDEAFALQQRAVSLAQGVRMEVELRAAYDEYAEALGRDPSMPLPVAPSPPWQGSINQAFRAAPALETLLVRPQTLADPEAEQAWVEAMASVSALYSRALSPDDPPLEVHLPQELDADDLAYGWPVLYGTPESNPWVAEVLAHHGASLEPEGLRIGERLIPAADPFLIAALPSPWNARRPVVVYTGLTDAGARGLNGVFHGPTALVLGSNGPGGARDTVVAVDLTVEDGVVVDLALGPDQLTGAASAEDLEALHALLAREYAGWSDLQWALRAQGTDWDARTEAFTARARGQERWSWSEHYDLLLEYLEPVQDTHFFMEGASLGPEGAVGHRDRLVDSLEPFFADGVVGADAHGLPVVPEPSLVEAGRPYLFPTLPQEGHPSAFLVGVFANPREPPEQLTLPSGEVLALHRGRIRAQIQGSWSLTGPPDSPLSTLGVRTMNQGQLEGLADTAIDLRGQPVVVLDLRNNHGGSDTPAHDWVTRFSREHYRWACAAQVVKDQDHPLRHWQSGSDSGYMISGGEHAEVPYGGRLAVFIDTGVASSGETFAFLAGTVQGAVLLGENSSGCSAYGNVEPHEPLPHSRVSLWFGRSRFVWECTRPVAEGVGMFPDYWLDVDDPVAWLAAHPEALELE